MIGTLLKRITVHTLDRVVERGKTSEHAPVRAAAAGLDRVRGLVGLDRIDIRLDLPAWDGGTPDQPMWQSDRDKLRKWQQDRGIIKPEKGEAKPAEPVLVIYYKRGCPYCRAALELVREQNLLAKTIDYTDDHDLRTAIRTRTGRRTTPHVFIRERCIGGFDELRELHESGRLVELLKDPSAAPPVAAPTAADDDDDDGDGRELAPAALKARLAEGGKVLLLDVREPSEWAQTGVIAGARTVSLGELDKVDDLDPQGVWIAYCRSGRRSLQAAEVLGRRGFKSVVSLRGGIEAWKAAGGATVAYEPAAAAPVAKKPPVKLPVVHPERSPFEALLDDPNAAVDSEPLEGEALIARVREVLETCRPLVQADGGDIELLDVTADTVGVRLTGNCVSCPSSQATLKQGIERKLKQQIPQIKGIRSPQLSP
ncbi:NifU family protein [Nannocystis pusilla]|uniref:NifU family protein n=1 Tax=Nannocystis pusilla TaxID=889268 RepID=A0ABS7TJL2_9BACT|nr:NifU family protein [Nannocystis pusilla]